MWFWRSRSHEATRIYRPICREGYDHGITTGVRLTEGLPKINGHKGQLEEVLLNLVRNAIEAMQTDKNDHRVLQVSSESGGDKIIVAVEDSAPGSTQIMRKASSMRSLPRNLMGWD